MPFYSVFTEVQNTLKLKSYDTFKKYVVLKKIFFIRVYVDFLQFYVIVSKYLGLRKRKPTAYSNLLLSKVEQPFNVLIVDNLTLDGMERLRT